MWQLQMKTAACHSPVLFFFVTNIVLICFCLVLSRTNPFWSCWFDVVSQKNTLKPSTTVNAWKKPPNSCKLDVNKTTTKVQQVWILPWFLKSTTNTGSHFQTEWTEESSVDKKVADTLALENLKKRIVQSCPFCLLPFTVAFHWSIWSRCGSANWNPAGTDTNPWLAWCQNPVLLLCQPTRTVSRHPNLLYIIVSLSL